MGITDLDGEEFDVSKSESKFGVIDMERPNHDGDDSVTVNTTNGTYLLFLMMLFYKIFADLLENYHLSIRARLTN